MKASIILPTYNEKGNIIKLTNSIIKSLTKASIDYEVVIVDDDSPDKTGLISEEYYHKNKKVKIFIRTKNKGFASAILYGINKATNDVIVVMDTDFSHSPKLLPKLISNINKYDLVIGSRYEENGGGENKKRYLLSKMSNLYLRVMLGVKVTDFLFGYFCARKSFLKKNHILTDEVFNGFGEYFMRVIYYVHKAKGSYKEFPAYYKERTYGVSKSNLLKMMYTYTKTSLQLASKDY